MLRYFTAVTSYQDIADACGVPVGTVCSRLNEARSRLHTRADWVERFRLFHARIVPAVPPRGMT